MPCLQERRGSDLRDGHFRQTGQAARGTKDWAQVTRGGAKRVWRGSAGITELLPRPAVPAGRTEQPRRSGERGHFHWVAGRGRSMDARDQAGDGDTGTGESRERGCF